ncbi:rhodanese-like domain-containing protein [Desulfohalobiaceae bacterium Ax17]|uniref:rhodanese-like domain-containing protein n=1 Tax=Desulfovulcanus ferrireducens TaxID=2831190 RepID=UPI00207BBBF0|nr:rhodanese-like domain-containing protein [Desulfovulcanus ferrireducens]MBT8763187.1 rhodanese-like domain-containing protein [Desulfovulcanus ferrireducens]
MNSFDNALREMDLDFFGSGEHGIGLDGATSLIGQDKAIFLDVRTHEEVQLLSFPFAKHIPVNEIPDRLNELPKDKLIIIFCSSIFRSALVYGYLLSKGFEQIKGLLASTEQLVTALKPGPIFKRQKV